MTTYEKLMQTEIDANLTTSQKAAMVRPLAVQTARKIERLRKKVIDVLVEASEAAAAIRHLGIDNHSEVLRAKNYDAVEVLKTLIDDVDFRDSIKITEKRTD